MLLAFPCLVGNDEARMKRFSARADRLGKTRPLLGMRDRVANETSEFA
jgi:hypothetical protein